MSTAVVDPEVNVVPNSIHYVAFGAQWISIPGSLFIIIWTWVHRKVVAQKGPAHRFPLYISIADLCFTVTHFIDHMIVLETGRYPTHHACQFFGWIFHFMSVATIMNVMSVSLYCCYTVVMLRRPDVGKYDWKILAFGFGGPFLFSFFPFMTDSYGHDAAWCWIDQEKPKHHLAYIVIPFLLFLVANVAVLAIIFYHLATMSSNSKTTMVKRSSLFVLAYVFQFTPIIVFSIQVYLGVLVPYNTTLFVVFSKTTYNSLEDCMHRYRVVCLTVCLALFCLLHTVLDTNLGGFLNVIVYGFGILHIDKKQVTTQNDHRKGSQTSKETPVGGAGGGGKLDKYVAKSGSKGSSAAGPLGGKHRGSTSAMGPPIPLGNGKLAADAAAARRSSLEMTRPRAASMGTISLAKPSSPSLGNAANPRANAPSTTSPTAPGSAGGLARLALPQRSVAGSSSITSPYSSFNSTSSGCTPDEGANLLPSADAAQSPAAAAAAAPPRGRRLGPIRFHTTSTTPAELMSIITHG